MQITVGTLRRLIKEAMDLACKECGALGAVEDPDRGFVPLCSKCSLAMDNGDAAGGAEADEFDRTAPSKRLARFGHTGARRYGSRHDV